MQLQSKMTEQNPPRRVGESFRLPMEKTKNVVFETVERGTKLRCPTFFAISQQMLVPFPNMDPSSDSVPLPREPERLPYRMYPVSLHILGSRQGTAVRS